LNNRTDSRGLATVAFRRRYQRYFGLSSHQEGDSGMRHTSQRTF